MRSARFVVALMVAAFLSQVALAQDKVQSRITVLVPDKGHKETVLTISGAGTEQSGPERKFMTPPLDKGSTYTYTFQAIVEPNNYTVITRTKAVTFKAGEEVKIDLTKEDEKNDKIVVRWVATPDDMTSPSVRVRVLRASTLTSVLPPMVSVWSRTGLSWMSEPMDISRLFHSLSRASFAPSSA